MTDASFVDSLLSANTATKVPSAGKGPEPSFVDALLAPQSQPQKAQPLQGESEANTIKGFVQGQQDLFQQQMKNAEGRRIKVGSGLIQVKNGIIQTSMEAMESAGILDKGTSDQFTKLTNEERKRFEASFNQEFGENAQFAVAEITGEVLPYLALPAAGATALARILIGAFTGGAVGATQFQTGETQQERTGPRATNATIGAAAGTAGASAVEGWLAARHLVTNKLAQAIEGGKEFAARGIEISRRTGVKFKLSQILGDPFVESMENLARAGSKGEREARILELNQSRDIYKFFGKLSRSLDDQGEFAPRVKTTFDSLMGDAHKNTGLLGLRASQANREFQAAAQTGDTVPIMQTLGKMQGLIDELSVPGMTGQNARLAQELTAARNDLIERGGGALDPVALKKNLEQWGRAAKGTGKLFTDQVDRAAEKAPAKAIYASLNKDLDEYIEQGGSDLLKIARDNYATNTAAIKEVEETALGKLFGMRAEASIDQIEKAFRKMKAPEMRATMDILGNADPTMHKGLQRFWIEKALEKAVKSTSADAFQYIPAKMLDMKKDREVYQAVFRDPATRRTVEDGLEAVRRIMMNNLTTGGLGVARMKQFMTSVAQRQASAIGREIIADIFAPQLVAKYVVNPDGVKALITLSTPQIAPRNAAIAAAALLQIAGDN